MTPQQIAEMNVTTEDSLQLSINLSGFFGFDFETVASREVAREKMLAACERHIDAFIEAVHVKPSTERKPLRLP